ncbi:hypothetical protein ACLOJK_017242 [Asimina triloba]
MALLSLSPKPHFKDPQIPQSSNAHSHLLPSISSLPFKTLRNGHSCSWKAPLISSRTSRSNVRASSTVMWEFDDDDCDETSSPWEGAVVYKRDPNASHVEYCTTLERLGLERLSSELSRSRASDMGLRVTKSVKDFQLGTPVLVSVDVTRKKGKLRLDGILRTVITLSCYRCAEPAAECIFSNFTLLLTEEPIEEPDKIYISMDKFRASGGISVEDEDSIDLDDQLYFPAGEKEIDISKNIRDMVHIEITMNAICDPSCKASIAATCIKILWIPSSAVSGKVQ